MMCMCMRRVGVRLVRVVWVVRVVRVVVVGAVTVQKQPAPPALPSYISSWRLCEIAQREGRLSSWSLL